MAYADQKMSSNRITAIVIVALLHALLGYAFVTGLAYNVVKKMSEDLKTFDVEEEPPPPEEEPPPPKEVPEVQPPPIVSPPPIIRTNNPPQIIQTVRVAPPPVITPRAAPAPPAPPPAPPPPPKKVEPARARANLASYVSDADYPAAAQRAEEQGTTGFRLTVGPDGRVSNCTITSSSGSSSLDSTTCRLMQRRAKFTPARDSSGNPTSDTVSSRIKWVLPED
jgi:periplasmic protein TonB